MDDDFASPESMQALKDLLSDPGNRKCADCGARNPKWASINFGVFVCIKCSNAHRALGPEISKLLSVNIGAWTNNDVDMMLTVGGNVSANEIYESSIPEGVGKPTIITSNEERADFIRRKYVDQEFVKPSLRMTSSVSRHPSHSLESTTSGKDDLIPTGKMGMVQSQEQGLLKVHIIKGTNLAVRDLKTSDPYVTVTIGSQRASTKFISSNLNPVWDEVLSLSVLCPPPLLKLEVFDKDVLSADDSMGTADVNLGPLISAAKIYEGVKTQGKMQIGRCLSTNDDVLVEDSIIWRLSDGKVTQELSLKLQNVESGILDIGLEWIPSSQNEDQEFAQQDLYMAPSISGRVNPKSNASNDVFSSLSRRLNSSLKSIASTKSSSQSKEFDGSLKVFVGKGENLAIRDSKSSDPYVKITAGNQTVKTRVIHKNLNPVWNDELVLGISIPPPLIKVEVFDYDFISADDPMGDAEIDLQPLVSAARIHWGIKNRGHSQIGKWRATNKNALVDDGTIWLTDDGKVTQELCLRLQHVESGILHLELEWTPLF